MANRSKVVWTAGVTQRGADERCAHHVERMGFEFWLPRCLERGRSGDRAVLMFPGYILIKIRPTDRWQMLHSAKGMSRLLMFGETYARVRDNEMRDLLGRRDSRGFVRLGPRLTRGDRVHERGGDSIWNVTEVTSDYRVRALGMMLGRSVERELEVRDLELV